MNIVEVKNLFKYFPIHKGVIFQKIAGYIKAVDDISFSIEKGETLGLVGESGSGKTTVGLLILMLLKPTRGSIFFQNEPILNFKDEGLNAFRQKVQIVFQDPFSSLNPRMMIKDIIGRPLRIHRLTNSEREVKERVLRMLEEVGLKEEHLNRYPHEFSGGQRQRIAVARSLISDPELIVLDEPTSALDVSVQAQVLNLFKHLQKKRNLSYLFVSHNMGVIKHISHKIAVMYLGKLVEYAPKQEIFELPLHPYTQALLKSIPEVTITKENIEDKVIKGDIPSPVNPPSGCRFRTRCPLALDICIKHEPEWRKVKKERFVACHLT
jgi:oligopeptide/dipeptide ABC transporter ATP-binding protein